MQWIPVISALFKIYSNIKWKVKQRGWKIGVTDEVSEFLYISGTTFFIIATTYVDFENVRILRVNIFLKNSSEVIQGSFLNSWQASVTGDVKYWIIYTTAYVFVVVSAKFDFLYIKVGLTLWAAPLPFDRPVAKIIKVPQLIFWLPVWLPEINFPETILYIYW